MNRYDDGTAPYAGNGPYWKPGTTWGTPVTDPSGDLFPHGYHTNPTIPDDGSLKEIISNAIDRDPSIPPDSQISVHLSQGTVTLIGSVTSGTAKRAAGNAAWYAPGVTDVRNEIKVG